MCWVRRTSSQSQTIFVEPTASSVSNTSPPSSSPRMMMVMSGSTARTAAAALTVLIGRRLWHRFRGQPDRADLDRPGPPARGSGLAGRSGAASGSVQERPTTHPAVPMNAACGVNVATMGWIRRNVNDSKDVWRCLIRWEWLPGVCVPYHTDGKIRAASVMLLKNIGTSREDNA